MRVIRRRRRVIQRPPVKFEAIGLWQKTDEKGAAVEGEPTEIGEVWGRLHRAFLGRDLMHVLEGDHQGWWYPVQ